MSDGAGRLVFSAAGAIIGTFIPGVGPSTGWMVGSLLGGALFPGSTQPQYREGARPTDLRIVSSALGQMIPIIKGRGRVAGNIIWSKPIDPNPITTTQTQGGKGQPKQTSTTVEYDPIVDCAIAICQGPISGIRRMWVNGELVYDIGSSASAASVIASNAKWRAARLYLGTETQLPDELIEADVGTGLAPAYRGVAYIVFDDLKADMRNIEFEVIEDGQADISFTEHDYQSFLGVSGAVKKITYLPTRQEVWTFSYIAPGSDLVAVHDLTTDTFTTFAPYAGTFPDTIAASLPYISEEDGLMFTSPNDSGGSSDSPAQVVDLATRAVIADFGQDLDGNLGVPASYGNSPSKAHVVGGDSTYIVYSYYSGLSGGNTYVDVIVARWDADGGTIAPMIIASVISTEAFPRCTGVKAGDKWWFYFRSILVCAGPSGVQSFEFMDDPAMYTSDLTSPPQYDSNRNVIYMVLKQSTGSQYYLVASFDLSTFTWTQCYLFNDGGNDPNSYAYDAQSDMLAVTRTNDAIERYSAATWTLVDSFTVGDVGSGEDIEVATVQTPPLDDCSMCFMGNIAFAVLRYGILEVRYDVLAINALPLSDVVTTYCAYAGLSAGDIDVTALTDIVKGTAISTVSSIRSALQPLQIAYFFDGVESDDKIKFVKRGGSVAATIADDELAYYRDGDNVPPLVKVTRALETELPIETRIEYWNDETDYQTDKQPARRQLGSSLSIFEQSVPVVLTSDEAQAIAQKHLYAAWAGRYIVEFTTNMKYAYLEPTDIVSVTADNTTYTLRLISRVENNGVIEWKGITEDSSVFDQDGIGGSYAAVLQSVGSPGGLYLQMLDLPLLRDRDDSIGFYGAMFGRLGNSGGDLWMSSSEDGDYTYTGARFKECAVNGVTTTALQDNNEGYIIDTLSSVTVTLSDPNAVLSSCTDTQLLLGENICYIGNRSGEGEVLGFGVATLVDVGVYTLSRLVRALRGTAGYKATHATGEMFVLLTDAALRRVGLAATDVGVTKYWRLPALGQSVLSASSRAVACVARSQLPLPPVHIGAGVTSNGNWDITITGVEQSRFLSDVRDYVDGVSSETIQSYKCFLYTDDTFTTLKRTLTATGSPSFTYAYADQITDYGLKQYSVYVRMCQVSATVGDGILSEPTEIEVAVVNNLHRYWRFTALTVSGSDGTQFSEIVTYEGSTDVSSTATVTASPSVDGGGPPSKLNDGILSGASEVYWNNARLATLWIKYDFGGTARNITKIRLGAYQNLPTYFPTGMQVQYSDDDSSWTTVTTLSGITNPGASSYTSDLTW